MVHRAKKMEQHRGAWIRGVLQRRPVRLATVALANKNARIAWALMTRSEVTPCKRAHYDRSGSFVVPVESWRRHLERRDILCSINLG
jgi:hypothetical protein